MKVDDPDLCDAILRFLQCNHSSQCVKRNDPLRKKAMDMKKAMQKKDFLTIPNFMSLFRILLIPLIV